MFIAASIIRPARHLAMAVFVSIFLAGCGQESPEKLMSSAREMLAQGNRNGAVIQLKNLLAQSPDNGEARLLLGQALFEAGDFIAAEKELGRALELKQPHEKVLPVYARTLLALGKNREVVTVVDRYKLFSPPAVAATQAALGDAYLQLGNPARAKEAFDAAVAAIPDYPRARLGLAVLAAAEGRLDDALRLADEVIAADPGLGEARSLRANILLARGDRAGARKTLEEAIAASKLYLPARLALVDLLTSERDLDAAAKLVESTRQVAPLDLRVNYLDASVAFHKGDLVRARQQVQEVLKYLPDDVRVLVLAGAIDLREKQLIAAEANLRRALAQAPKHQGARQLLVRTYLLMGLPAKAKEALQPLVEGGMPMSPRLQMLAGETYLANGEVQKATSFYEAAAQGAAAQQVAARTRLGQIALAAGRSEVGFEELEAASALDAGDYQADLALIAAHLRRNDLGKAMAAVQALERKQPNNPLTFQMYGVVNSAKRDFDAARKSFDKALELQPTYLPSARSLAVLDVLQKKPEDARRRYEAMIAKEPTNEELYLALAELQERTGASPKDIGGTLQRAVKANPQAPKVRAALINFELRFGDGPKAALAAAQDALARIPSDPSVLDAAGVAQETAGEVNQAIDTYNKLASLQPQAVQPLYRLAALYLRQNNTEKAIESLRRVQKIAPNDSEVVAQLVRVYIAAGRQAEATREAREFQRREPKSARGYVLEGDVYVSRGALTDAERLYREALKLDPKANVVAAKLHATLSAARKSADAAIFGKKWLAENPKDVPMRLYLAQYALASRDFEAAAALYRSVVGIDPDNVEALNNLAWIAGDLGDAKALGYAERAMKLAPNDATVLDTYGMLLVKSGDAGKGLSYLERSRKLAPARSDLRLNYAKALIKAGKKEDARRELEALQAVKESFPGKDEVAGLLKGL